MKKFNCTCTLEWIYLYNEIYEKRYPALKRDYYEYFAQNQHIILENMLKYCDNDFSRLNCDFERKLNNCQIKSSEDRLTFKLNNDISVFFLLKWIQFFLLLIFQPFSVFFLNLEQFFDSHSDQK